jgi:hypothetical protein
MDGKGFDHLTRSLALSSTRRRVLAGLAAGVLGVIGSGQADAAVCRSVGRTCRGHGNCCSHLCGPKDTGGHRVCQCQSPADCPVPEQCHEVTCQNGVCGTNVTTGKACGEGKTCCASGDCGVCCSDADCPASTACASSYCDPKSRVCKVKPLPAGTDCSGDDKCSGKTCDGAGTCIANPVVCTPLDQCHVAGTCDPSTGTCSNPQADFGTNCNDGDACTTGDHCVQGECTGTPVVCEQVDDPHGCWNQPYCDKSTGSCVAATPKASGTACDDGNKCHLNSTCDGNGVCAAGSTKTCGDGAGGCPQKCDAGSGECVPGEDGDSCLPNGIGVCQTGVCQGGGCVAVPKPVGTTCFADFIPPLGPCEVGLCDADGSCSARAGASDGASCDPDDLGDCQSGGVCQSGVCQPTNKQDGTLCGDELANECDRMTCRAGACVSVSREGERCETALHGCIFFTCQNDQCLDSGQRHDCNSPISCGGFGTCVEELPGIGECHPIVCDCCGGECGKKECKKKDGSTVCWPTNQICEGLCQPEPVECCGGIAAGEAITCPYGTQCCTTFGGLQCCPPTQTCGPVGCGIYGFPD